MSVNKTAEENLLLAGHCQLMSHVALAHTLTYANPRPQRLRGRRPSTSTYVYVYILYMCTKLNENIMYNVYCDILLKDGASHMNASEPLYQMAGQSKEMAT